MDGLFCLSTLYIIWFAKEYPCPPQKTNKQTNIIPLLIKNLEMFESEIKENSSQSITSPPKEIHPILPTQRRILKILNKKKF